MKKILLPAFFTCLFAGSLYAQEPLKFCGSDEVSYQLYHDNPSLQGAMQANRDALKAFAQKYMESLSERSIDTDSVYVVPVVFHIIHTYGAENISDAQVMSGLKVMNWNFGNANPDTSEIIPTYKPIAANCDIQFQLAHIDPNGNCTSGIERIPSLLTNTGLHNVKALSHWDPAKYLNVYVVKNIETINGDGLSGYCLMPDQAVAMPAWDGIVVDYDYVGDTGTSNPTQSVTLPHEAGHFLNLFHVWGGNNVPGYYYLPVGQDTNCFVGDDVYDDPKTIGWTGCNLSAASCGNAVDNVQNAMNYSFCNFMFTIGQRARMRAALNDTIASRNNLITPQNLAATGVNLTTLCSVSFSASQQVVCAGDTIYFTDHSIATPDSWSWNFGDWGTSNQQNPAHVFPVPGDYYVTLTATRGSITTTSDSFHVHVNNPYVNNAFYVQSFESINSFSEAQLFTKTDNAQLSYNISAPGQGYNSAYSAVIHMADTTETYTGRNALISPVIDLNHLYLPLFSFKYAFSQRVPNNYDQLQVFISKDCGKTWLSEGSKISTTFRTTDTAEIDSTWVPQDSAQWKTFSFSVPSAYCVPNFMFKIEFTNYQGNSLYIDNIDVNSSAYTGIQKIPLQGIELMPNPAGRYIEVSGLPEAMPCQVIDVNGKVWVSLKSLNNADAIDISGLAPGVYILRLENDIAFCNKRFVKF